MYWQALIVVGVMYLSRFDAAFLSLRAKSVMSKSALTMLTLVNMLIQVPMAAAVAGSCGLGLRAYEHTMPARIAVTHAG